MLSQARVECASNYVLFCLFHAPVEGLRVGTYSLISLRIAVTFVCSFLCHLVPFSKFFVLLKHFSTSLSLLELMASVSVFFVPLHTFRY
jgi:hypothetical protein